MKVKVVITTKTTTTTTTTTTATATTTTPTTLTVPWSGLRRRQKTSHIIVPGHLEVQRGRLLLPDLPAVQHDTHHSVHVLRHQDEKGGGVFETPLLSLLLLILLPAAVVSGPAVSTFEFSNKTSALHNTEWGLHWLKDRHFSVLFLFT